MMHVGISLSTVGMFSTMGGCHDKCWGISGVLWGTPSFVI